MVKGVVFLGAGSGVYILASCQQITGKPPLKRTVPEGIVEFLKLEDKDELEWGMEVQNDQRIAIVKKAIHPKDSVELAKFALKQKRRHEQL